MPFRVVWGHPVRPVQCRAATEDVRRPRVARVLPVPGALYPCRLMRRMRPLLAEEVYRRYSTFSSYILLCRNNTAVGSSQRQFEPPGIVAFPSSTYTSNLGVVPLAGPMPASGGVAPGPP